MENVLSLVELCKWYTQGSSTIIVLKDVSATFKKGHSYAITGISGSGKSTLLHLLAGLDTPSSGALFFNGINIQSFNDSQKSIYLNKSLGLVFQNPYLIKELTVLENVMIKGLIAGKGYNTCMQEAKTLIEHVGLSAKIVAFPGQLSGGQQQRVALARALMNQPEFLLADEPTGNLDLQTGQAIIDLILQLQKEWNMGLIISSHDEYVTRKMETVYTLKEGKLFNNYCEF